MILCSVDIAKKQKPWLGTFILKIQKWSIQNLTESPLTTCEYITRKYLKADVIPFRQNEPFPFSAKLGNENS